ncbi:1-deoxy-D-xylulose-5-phosphate reductoisomerase [bacterium]|nr:1-deoxy-D-xylulose-5-phosphate reductoisomerase [bacterium]
MNKKRISIWGSTGSIGTQTLDVVRQHPERFKIVNLVAHKNAEIIFNQAKEFRPSCVILTGEVESGWHSRFHDMDVRLETGPEALITSASSGSEDMVVNGLVGAVGLTCTVNAIQAGVNIALANKEVLVMAGDLINSLLRNRHVKLIPVDSEHSAIFQCLQGESPESIRRLILTASGGPFRSRSLDELKHVTVKEALAHPNWDMGAKITIDSATMINKALEIIEARWLFGVSPEQIEVVIHPQSILHSMVEFVDGSLKAQLSVPDMRVPIAYALSWPDRLGLPFGSLDISKLYRLEMIPPDPDRFPALKLAYQVLETGGTAPAVFNGADEAAVKAFLDRKIEFTQITECIMEALNRHQKIDNPSLEQIINADQEARDTVQGFIRLMK